MKLDLTIPKHSEAYLLAASHILSDWPQEWTAEHLDDVLLADEGADPDDAEATALLVDLKQVKPCESLVGSMNPMDDPYLFVWDLIYRLAEDIVFFAENYNRNND
ncbi:MAG: hypothetical protein ACK5H0_10505 [Bacteroidota bacterium]|jgi:hypothetical protein